MGTLNFCLFAVMLITHTCIIAIKRDSALSLATPAAKLSRGVLTDEGARRKTAVEPFCKAHPTSGRENPKLNNLMVDC